MQKYIRTILAALLLLLPCATRAGFTNTDVTWGSATTISGDTDVISTGSLYLALNVGGTSSATPSATTVNGVLFSPFSANGPNPVTVGSVQLFENASGGVLNGLVTSSTSAPFTSLSSAYQSLLGVSVDSFVPNTLQMTIGGLTPGQAYLIQLWSNDSAFPDHDSTTVNADGFLSTAVLQQNAAGSTGALGQFVTGTFTALDTIERIDMNGGQAPLLTAMQIRTVTAVPEPASSALLAMGVAGMVAIWRRQR